MIELAWARRALVVAVLLVFGGAWLASAVQRSGGDVDVHDVRFVGTDATMLSALLYVPHSATQETPAPGVVAIHGYINSREMQSPYAIELARRGYVVLALDQTGHGYSDPPAFAHGFGGADALRYLSTLDIVNPERIVLSGHSMGGWASLVAAGVHADRYHAVVVSGSSTGVFGAPEGTPVFPRNFALVWGRYDEFSELMWGAPVAADIVHTQKLQTLFGTQSPVQPAQLYGSLEDGTARRLYLLPQTHPANHITRSGIGAVVDWVQTTTPAPQMRAPGDQIWYWKELGTTVSLLGGLLWLPALGGVLLGSSYFGAIRAPLPPANGLRGRGWWVAAGIFALLPALTYFPLQLPGLLITPNAWLPQNVTNGILTWALGSAMIALALLLGWHYASADRRRDGFAAYGLARMPASTLGRTVLLGVVIVGTAHLLVVTTAWLFTTDFRIWIIAAKPLDALRAGIALGYVVPFVAFFVVVGAVMHGQLRDNTAPSFGRIAARNAVLMGLGIAVLLAVQYVPLFAGGAMPLSGTPWTLLTIVAIQFVVLLPITGAISTYFFHATGQVYLGGVVNGLLVTWMIVSTQAIQYSY